MPAPSRRLWEALYEAYLRYVPQPYAGPVAFFRARTNPLFRPLPLDMGWRPFISGGLEIDRIPGSHDGILREPHVSLLAARLRDAMDRFAQHAER
jgi:thioesterase domain-containing protein